MILVTLAAYGSIRYGPLELGIVGPKGSWEDTPLSETEAQGGGHFACP